MNVTPPPSPGLKPATAVILVVDDSTKNIQVVGSILTEAGYELMPATSGAQALARVQNHLPDLILLDLMMPEMDGIEVCRLLKDNPATQEIPVIFLTASNETTNLMNAFEVGAVDYVTKPFNPSELLARVKTHLELKQTREALQNYSNRLRELNEEKNELMGIAAHDLRNPLNNLLGCTDLLLANPALETGAREDCYQIMSRSIHHMLHLVENLLDVNAIETGTWNLDLVPCDLAEITRSVLLNFQNKAAAKQQSLHAAGCNAPIAIQADRNGTIQVISNLISNAIKFSPPGKSIYVRLVCQGAQVRLEVQDEGPGLSEKDQSRLFIKFARLSAKPTADESSTGLGLSIVKRMVELMRGRVGCYSQLGHGATFYVEWSLLTERPGDAG